MSQHYHYPTREEFARRLSGKSVPGSLKTAALAATLLGVAVFAYGLFTHADRAWQALHFNWLYFAVISTAGTAFAAVVTAFTGMLLSAIVILPTPLTNGPPALACLITAVVLLRWRRASAAGGCPSSSIRCARRATGAWATSATSPNWRGSRAGRARR